MNKQDYVYVVDLVKQAGKLAFQMDLDIKIKECIGDFVTQVDISVMNFLRDKLNEKYPEIDFYCEEDPDSHYTDYCWILDPIDGTTNLVHGYRQCGISLALLKDNESIFGIVYNPFTDECFTAIKGKGAYLNGTKRLHVSDRPLNLALIEFGAESNIKTHADMNFNIAKDLFRECVDIRRLCTTAMNLCYIADGRIEGYFEGYVHPWDFGAGILMVSEAGGITTDFEGNNLDFSKPSTTIISGNGIVNQQIQDAVWQHYNKGN